MQQARFFHFAHKSRMHQSGQLLAQVVVVGACISDQWRFEPGREIRIGAQGLFDQGQPSDRRRKQRAPKLGLGLRKVSGPPQVQIAHCQQLRQSRLDHILAQRFHAGDPRVLQRQAALDRQLPPRLLDRLAQCAPQQTLDAAAMRGTRFIGALEYTQGHALAQIDQGWISNEAAVANHALRQLIEVEAGHILAGQLGVGAARKCRACAVAPLCPDRFDIATRGQGRAVFIVDAKAHGQMQRQGKIGEFARCYLDAGNALQIHRQRFSQRLIARRLGQGKGARKIRRRHEIAAQGFGQATDHFRHLVRQQAGHQPVAARGGNRVDEGQWHMQGDAIGGIARDEAVLQLELVTGKFQRGRKIAGADAGLVRQHEIQRPAQRGLLDRWSLPIPRVERGGRVDVRRQLAFEEFHQFLLVLDQATAPPFGLDFVRLRQHARIRAHAVGTRVDLATHQRLAQKHGMRQCRVLCAKLHVAFFHQHQTE